MSVSKGAEKLREYLEASGQTQVQAARAAGRSEAWVSRLLSGEIPESRVTVRDAARLATWSDGAVPVSCWAEDQS